jgi:hypothetical protein
MARTKTEGRGETRTFREGRLTRGSTGQGQAGRRFGRPSAASRRGITGKRRRQPEPNGAQKLIRAVQGVLPGGGSSAKTGKRSSGGTSKVDGVLSSLRRQKQRGGWRSRKPAMVGLLGAGAAGAAGAAAAVAKRRQTSGSEPASGALTGTSESGGTSTATPAPAHGAEASTPTDTAHGSGEPAGEAGVGEPDTPPADEQRG